MYSLFSSEIGIIEKTAVNYRSLKYHIYNLFLMQILDPLIRGACFSLTLHLFVSKEIMCSSVYNNA